MPDLRPPFDWRVFVSLFMLGSLATLLAFPWPPPPIQLAAALASVALALAGGVALGPRCGLGAPLLQRLVRTGRLERADYRGAAQGFAAGAVLGIGMLLLLRLVLVPARPELAARFAAEAGSAIWQRSLVAFDSAVVEEIGFRFFLLTLMIFVAQRFSSRPGGAPTGWPLWIPLALTAALFGAAHLPRWAETAPLSVPLATAVVLLNSSGALVFGYAFARKGLESAILAHFAADLVLHVVGAPILAQAI